MAININEPNIRVQQPPPAAFQGKSIEQVVLELMGRVSTLEAKLTASKDRIVQLETKVEQPKSVTDSLPQKAAQHAATLEAHATTLEAHSHSLYKLTTVFNIESFGPIWRGTGPQDMKLKIKAKEIWVESLSKLRLSSTHELVADTAYLALEARGTVRLRGSVCYATYAEMHLKTRWVNAPDSSIHCKSISANNLK